MTFKATGKFKDLVVTSKSGNSRFRMFQPVIGANLYVEESSCGEIDSGDWVEIILKPYVATGSTTDTGRTYEALAARPAAKNFEADLWESCADLDPVFVEKRAYNPSISAKAPAITSVEDLADVLA